MTKLLKRFTAFAIITAILPLGAAMAQSMSSDEIIGKLKTKKSVLTRSFGKPKPGEGDALSSNERSFVRSMGGSRAIKIEQRDKLIAIVDNADLPSINIQINFDYNSAQIKSGSFGDLEQLAKALNDNSLEYSTIMLNGHTDASGSIAYNQDLSERRARSVKLYLVNELSVSGKRLVSAGFGEERLKNKADKNSAVNRRVEIINLGE